MTSLPWFVVKLILVLVLVVLLILIEVRSRKAKKGDVGAQLKKMETLGKMTLIIGILIVFVAVTVFH